MHAFVSSQAYNGGLHKIRHAMAGDNQGNTLTKEETQERWVKIADQVEAMWSEVIKVVDNVLQAHTKFGFSNFADKISPSLEEILLSVRVVESILDAIDGALEYSETRTVGNAKQQILWIQTIGNALKYGNETDYLASIEKLGKQSRH